MSIKVFVYGTLMSGHYNHRLLVRAKFLGEDVVENFALFQVTPGFPGVKMVRGEKVKGEVYEIDKDILRNLDRLEGCYNNGPQSLYLRKETTTQKGHKVYIYVWNRSVKIETKIPFEQQPWRKVKELEH